MAILNNKITAIIITVLFILMSIFIIGGNNLISLKSNVNTQFEEGTYASPVSIQSQIDRILGQANNMLLISRRYVDNEDEIILPLIIAIENLNNAENAQEKYKYTNELVAEIESLNNQAHILNMSERDINYFQSIEVNVTSYNRIISNSDYNLVATNFNNELTKFPANIISLVRGIKPAYIYG